MTEELDTEGQSCAIPGVPALPLVAAGWFVGAWLVRRPAALTGSEQSELLNLVGHIKRPRRAQKRVPRKLHRGWLLG